jgi:hypothetical protein
MTKQQEIDLPDGFVKTLPRESHLHHLMSGIHGHPGVTCGHGP